MYKTLQNLRKCKPHGVCMHMHVCAFVHACVGASIRVHMWKDVECPVLSLSTYSSEMDRLY